MMTSLPRRFLRDTSGATAIEYGLIAGLIACFLIGTFQNMGAKVGNKLGRISNALS